MSDCLLISRAQEQNTRNLEKYISDMCKIYLTYPEISFTELSEISSRTLERTRFKINSVRNV